MSGFVFADPNEVKIETAEDAELLGAERDFQRARELFNQGKTSKAVDLFSSSLEIRTKHFGKENVSLADHYRLYGEALLALVTNQSDPFGGMIKQTVEDKAQKLFDEADGDEDVDDEEDSDEEEAAEEGEKKEGEETPAEEKKDNAEAANNNDAEGEDDEDGEDVDEDDEEDGPQEDPEALLEIAWECLENARVLNEKAERWVAASDAMIALGDIAMEGSQLDSAIAEYQKALEMRQKHLPDANDRRIAEAHFQVALALSLTPDGSDKAREHYTKARDILQLKVNEMKAKPASDNNSNATTAANGDSSQTNGEVQELEQLIKELNEKIDDEGIKEDPDALPDLPPLPDLTPVPLSSTTGFAAPTNPSAPVNNLGVVKRKNPRKVTPEVVPAAAENADSEASRGLKRKSDEITPDPNENTDPNTAPTKKLKESVEVEAPVPAPLS